MGKDQKEGGMMDDMKDMMEDKSNEEMGNNSLTDLLKGLMCNEEGEERSMEDMCEKLDAAMCKKAMKKGCMLKGGVCYNAKAGEGEKNLFATYNWQYLYKDGEATTDGFCYAEETTPTEIKTMTELNDYCSNMSESDCKGLCAMGKLKKKDKKKGLKAKCAAGKAVKKGKVKCSKIKSNADDCEMIGCEVKQGKKFKCTGSVKLGN